MCDEAEQKDGSPAVKSLVIRTRAEEVAAFESEGEDADLWSGKFIFVFWCMLSGAFVIEQQDFVIDSVWVRKPMQCAQNGNYVHDVIMFLDIPSWRWHH